MAINVSIQPVAYIGETSVTVGQISGSTTKTITFTVPSQFSTNNFVLVSLTSTIQDGLGIAGAWVSAAGTVSVKFVNATGGALTPTGDPLTLKYIIL